ncbi:hypothetical protein B0H16DRAFT_1030332 [Mycena metata]|uniref:Secreted protein n=1 Tax=Mycena metata TaxID=1033252 RepID=A0AAD7IHH1_9AGAR|nr:hypothetical protein B0H16DRAFT_1030332 [Mycena metata]
MCCAALGMSCLRALAVARASKTPASPTASLLLRPRRRIGRRPSHMSCVPQKQRRAGPYARRTWPLCRPHGTCERGRERGDVYTRCSRRVWRRGVGRA